ncbi:hypothetical protein PHYSODRAFT_339666 [Phytophthora sojae]|uniref:Heat shock protein 70 n=1 Tax=Phytophthora sojae (strain P6497) TaxID=1094619 RepID=G5A5D8_PHYSP|nr:hypothetical protein PHYSODRAFT_339666 [Phytophthora sojae]EGZ09322.1 hypothetical protein PHYSODRAFT_339666 [Phytophthora sojae]|eukprot:XP_009535955.1 hypothetical protein PHYSODRAFT_339666 [Phytophthora sojae]
MDLIVGIDLGTTGSRVGVWRNERVEFIPNRQQAYWTPSYVAFTETALLVGEAAKRQLTTNPENTVFDLTQFVGRKFSELRESVIDWPFKVECGPEDTPQVVVQYKGETKSFMPVEIMAILLYEMRKIAEIYLDQEVTKAVFTVPGSFNYFQRQAMKDAGAIAGLDVIRLVNSATVACIEYGFNTLVGRVGELNVLVVDYGASSLNFDSRLVEHFAAEFQRRHGKDLRSDSSAVMRLRTACEHAKRALSSSMEAFIELDALHDGINFYSMIRCVWMERLCADLFDKMLRLVEKLLREARLRKDQVDEIVLVGGSTHVPKVQQKLKDFFNGKMLSLRQDEAAAFGVAVQGDFLGGLPSPKLDEYMLLDTASLEFSVEIDDCMMKEVPVSKNSTLPMRKSRTFLTANANKSTMRIKAFEGEATTVATNRLLCEFEMDGITMTPGRLSEIEVAIDVDANGSLTVSAVEKSTGKEKKITINCSRLSTSEVERMHSNIEETFLDPEEELRIQSKAVLERYANSVCSSAAKRIAKLKRSLAKEYTIESSAMEALQWLDTNPSAKKEHFDAKRQKLGEMATPSGQRNSGAGAA